MKAHIALPLFVLLIFNATVRASDEDEVRVRDDQERVAALKRDVSSLEQLWSNDFTVNAPNNRIVVGKKAVLDIFVRGGIINFSSFERNVEYLRVDGEFAVVMGLEVLVPVSSAPSAGLTAGEKVMRRFTNIWKRESGTWRLYWRHANVTAAP